MESPQLRHARFNAVRARYGEQGLLELTAVMSVYTMNAAILRVMDHEAAADAERPRPQTGVALLASSLVGSMTSSGFGLAVARQRLASARGLSSRSGEIFYVRLHLLW